MQQGGFGDRRAIGPGGNTVLTWRSGGREAEEAG